MAAFETALRLHRVGNRREALSYYQKALQQDPNDHRALYWLGVLNFQGGDITRAQNHMQKAVELASDVAEYRLGYGRFLQETGRPSRAVRHLRAALKLKPDNTQARYRLAMVLHRVGEHDEALGHYRALAAEQENNPSVLVHMGALLDLMGRSADAIPIYERAIEIAPSSAPAHGHLGRALARLNRFDAAIEAFETCLKLQPGQPKIYASLGSCELGRGDLDAARAAYERCLRAMPGDNTSLAMLAAIHNEQENPDPALALLDYDALIHTSIVDPGASGYQSQDFLAALRQHVLSHPTLPATGDVRQTKSLAPAHNQAVGHLAGFIDRRVQAYRAARPERWQPFDDLPPLWPAPETWRIEMWATVLGPDASLAPQIKPAGWLSGFFHIDAPQPEPDAEHRGQIEFGSLPDQMPLSVMPVVHRYQPRPCELILFPSYFFHRTMRIDSDAARVRIGFDVIATHGKAPAPSRSGAPPRSI